jgi:osmotically-inducible protein OsmY
MSETGRESKMSTLLRNDGDYQTREAVEAELRWSPKITDAAKIGVTVVDGIVTLWGEVSSYYEKLAAGKAALRTRGVTAIANDITVRHGPDVYSDARLARDAQEALRLNVKVPRNRVDVEVRDHRVVLTGTVDWEYQRRAAQRVVETLHGVKGVTNDIELSPRVASEETYAKIRDALVRNANVDATHIMVNVEGTDVTLTGTVSSAAEKRLAGLAAWSSPHVRWVQNQLRVVTS